MPEVLEQATPGAVVHTGALVTPGGAQGPPGAQGPAGTGIGDMTKAVYDVNGDNIVDQAAAAPWAGITGKPATFPPDSTAELVARKGVAGGYPSLDAGTLVPIAQLPAPTSGDAGATQLVKGNDSRLTNARTPTAHAPTHKSGGSDAIKLDELAAPADVTTLNASTSAHGLMPKASGSATTFYGSDGTQKQVPYSSLSGTPSTFAPSAHQASHVTGGGDVISGPTTTASGLVPKLPTANVFSSFLRGDGTFGSLPVANNTQAGVLNQLSGNTTDFVDGTNACQNLVTAIDPEIWSQRLRSFNAIGNPHFEVAQRNARAALVNPANGTFIEDRWAAGNLGSLNPTFQTFLTALTPGSGIVVPGTSQVITTGYLRITVGTQKASLAAGDACYLTQNVEGPCFRELMSDVHSVSLLVRSSVANLKFGLGLGDSVTTKSLVKLCSLGAANTITLIQLPNLPIWPAGNFTAAVGSLGYILRICLASGSTFMAPANDTWQNGNFLGAVGQSNLMASAPGATFEVFMVQHEPGSLCSTFMDKPFAQNLDECLRYFCKTYQYGTKPGTIVQNGAVNVSPVATVNFAGAWGWFNFPKIMAKLPTMNGISPTTGANNAVRDGLNGVDRGITAAVNLGENGFGGFGLTSPPATGNPWYMFHFTADTGW